mgnify:CR=1 FL=1
MAKNIKDMKPKAFHILAEKMKQAMLSADIKGVAKYGITYKMKRLEREFVDLCGSYEEL